MATRGGAAAIGLGDITGQLKAGMRADMIQLDVGRPSLSPLYNVISHLVYAVDSSDVVSTMVSGQMLMKDRKVLTLNRGQVKKAADQKGKEIAAALSRRQQNP